MFLNIFFIVLIGIEVGFARQYLSGLLPHPHPIFLKTGTTFALFQSSGAYSHIKWVLLIALLLTVSIHFFLNVHKWFMQVLLLKVLDILLQKLSWMMATGIAPVQSQNQQLTLFKSKYLLPTSQDFAEDPERPMLITGRSCLPGHCGQQESCVRMGFWQRRGGQTSVSHRTRPLWHVHCVQESIFHVSPSTKYSPPGAWQIDGLLSSGFCTIDSSRKRELKGKQMKICWDYRQ